MAKSTTQTRNEELVNAITHGLGIVLGFVALFLLIDKTQDQPISYKISAAIFSFGAILVYSSSTLYHIVQKENLKRILKKVDHMAIYVLIAATYTPLLLLKFPEQWGIPMLWLIWIFATFGIIFKLFIINRFKVLSVITYLAMGWLIMVAIGPLIESVSHNGLLWIIAGGASYCIGLLFYVWRLVPYHHAVWHLFVLLGTTCHFFAIWWHVL